MVRIDRSDGAVSPGITRHGTGLVKPRLPCRVSVSIVERLARRILPVEVFREVSAVIPGEHVHIVQGRSGILGFRQEIVQDIAIVTPAGGDKHFSATPVIVCGTERRPITLMCGFRSLRKLIPAVRIEFLEEGLARIHGPFPSFIVVVPVACVLVGLRMPWGIGVECRACSPEQDT